MDIGEDINKVTIEVEIEDKTSQGLQQTEQKVTASAEQIGQALDQKMGAGARAATGQVTKLDKSLKNATDTNNLASKSVNKLVRMFNPFSMAVGFAIGQIVSFAKSMLDSIDTSINQYNRALEEVIKNTKELADSTANAIEKERMLALGVTEDMLKAMELRSKKREAEAALIQAEIELQSAEGRQYAHNIKNLGMFTGGMDDEIKKRRENIQAIKDSIQTLGQEAEYYSKKSVEERVKKALEPTKPKGKGGVKEEKGFKGWGQGEEIADQFRRMEAMTDGMAIRMREIALGVTEASNEMMSESMKGWEEYCNAAEEAVKKVGETIDRVAQENYDRSMTIKDNLARKDQEYYQFIESSLGTVTDLALNIAKTMGQGNQKFMKVIAYAEMVIDAIKAARMYAQAIEYAIENDWAKAAESLAAGASFTAAAVMAGKYAVSSPPKPGRASSGSENASAFGGSKQDRPAITIQVLGNIFDPRGQGRWLNDAYNQAQDVADPGRTRGDVR